MARVLFLALVVRFLIGAASCVAAEPSRAERLLEELYDPAGRVLVAAHRGDWRNFPENSPRAIDSAIEMGCDIVEIDIRVTRDGHYVVLHDKTLDRTTTGSGKVSHHSLAEIKGLRLLNGYGMPTEEVVPTLEEALELCRGRVLVYIDKSEHAIAEVHQLAESLGVQDQVLYYGHFDAGKLDDELGSLAKQLHYLPKLGDGTTSPGAYLRGFAGRVPAFVTSFETADSVVLEQFRTIRESGSRVWASPLWPELCAGRTDDAAIDDPEAAWGWLIDRGASILCTDRPARLIAYLRGR